MISAADQFQMKGFASVPGVFSRDETEEMRENVTRYLKAVAPGLQKPLAVSVDDGDGEADGKNDPDRYVFLGRMNLHDSFFERMRLDPRLAELARELLGGEVEAQHVQFLNIVPGICSATPPHQDAPIFSIEPSHAVTFWIPLCEIDEERGCLHYVPGSHWQGYRKHADSGPRRLADEGDCRDIGVAMPVNPGELLAHHCLTIHYSAENPSGKNRWALAVHFFPVGSQCFDEAEWVRRRGV